MHEKLLDITNKYVIDFMKICVDENSLFLEARSLIETLVNPLPHLRYCSIFLCDFY